MMQDTTAGPSAAEPRRHNKRNSSQLHHAATITSSSHPRTSSSSPTARAAAVGQIGLNAMLRVMVWIVLAIAVAEIVMSGRLSSSIVTTPPSFPLEEGGLSSATPPPHDTNLASLSSSSSPPPPQITTTSSPKAQPHKQVISFQPQPQTSVHTTSHWCHSRDFKPDGGKRASCLFHHICVVPAPSDDSVHEVQWLYVQPQQQQSQQQQQKTLVDASFTLGVGPHSVDAKLYFEPVLITPDQLQIVHPNRTYISGTSVMTYEYNAENFGHMLTDVFLPLYAALESFGLEHHPVHLYRYSMMDAIAWSCDYHIGLGGKTAWGNVAAHCARFYRVMSEMALGHSEMHVLNGTTVTPTCFERLVVGTPMYSDDCLEGMHGRDQNKWSLCNHGKQRQFWNFRNYVLRNVGVSREPPSTHKITITKREKGGLSRNLRNFDELVETVKKKYAETTVEVVVVEWHTLSLHDQLELIRTTTVHVTPPGGVSFVALFLPRWATSIRLYTNDFRMEFHLFHYLGYIQVEHVDCQGSKIPIEETLRYIEQSMERFDLHKSLTESQGHLDSTELE